MTLHNVCHQRLHIAAFRIELHLSCSDFLDIQNVIDQTPQSLRAQ